MKLTPLTPALPEEGAGPRWGLVASAVFHGLVLLALLGFAVHQLPADGSPSPSYDLVFEGPSGAPPPSTAPQTQKLPPAQPADIPPPPDAVPGPPAPTPLSTPDPNSTTAPPPAADAAPPPVPEAVPPPTPSPAATQAPAAPATPSPPLVPAAPPDQAASLPLETPPTEAPTVRLELPPAETAPAAPEPIMPQPPPPLPPVEPPARPSRPAVRPAPRPALGTLSNPMNLSLGPAAPRPAARGSVASRSLDLSAPLGHDGPAKSDPYAQIRAANASADWNRGLLQYWLQHRFYPEQAAANGDQGSVTIQLTVNRSGRVEDVEILSKSGSQWLDMAALATWRNARLPPFTNEMREDRITFPIPIQYYLIR